MGRDWIDYTSAIGSIATAATLIYLLIKEWKTRKHITDLGVIATKLSEQTEVDKVKLKLQLQPRFGLPKVYERDTSIDVAYINEGQPCVVTNAIFCEEVKFTRNKIPSIIRTDAILLFRGRLVDKPFYECPIHILVYFDDLLGNSYLMETRIINMEITLFKVYDKYNIPEDFKLEEPGKYAKLYLSHLTKVD
jgi:hypothetical protein